MPGVDLQVASVTSITTDTTKVFLYDTTQPGKAFPAASVLVNVTTISGGTWTFTVFYNGVSTTDLTVFSKSNVNTVSTNALTPSAPFNGAGTSIPSAMSCKFAVVGTTATTLTATVRLIAVT